MQISEGDSSPIEILTPVYKKGVLYKSIYAGKAALTLKEKSVFGKATLRLDLVPVPRCILKFLSRRHPLQFPCPLVDTEVVQEVRLISRNSSLCVGAGSLTCKTNVGRSSQWTRYTYSGNAKGVSENSREFVGRLRGHLFGFYQISLNDTIDNTNNLTRSIIDFGDRWRLTLDSRFGAHEWEELVNNLKIGKYPLTHVYDIRSIDDRLISSKHARKLVEFLDSYFALINGSFVGPIATFGSKWQKPYVWFDAGRGLTTYPISVESPYACNWSFDHQHTGSLSIAGALWEKWCSKENRDWIELAISIYCEASRKDIFDDLSICISQMGLELLSGLILVKMKKIISKNAYEKLKASDTFSILVNFLGLWNDIEILKLDNSPSCSLTDLCNSIRNNLTHPFAKSKENYYEHLFYARQVSLYFLEMAILYAIGYTGKYYDRLTGRTGKVPWADK